MKEGIDKILADLLTNETLDERDRQFLEEWKSLSAENERAVEMVERLKRERKVLDRHQKQDAVFRETQRRVFRRRRRQRLIAWSSCAAGIALFIGILLVVNRRTAPNDDVISEKIYLSGLALNRPLAELILPNGESCLLDTVKSKVIVSDSSRDIRTDKTTLIVKANQKEERESEYYTLNIPLGAEYDVLLPDGTRVYLNAGTSLRYPDRFTGDKREVFLSGEAYFEVTSDSVHPFIVRTPDVALRVLGTAFNVNAYADEEWVKTTLVRGRVEARYGNEGSIFMQPGTQVAYHKDTHTADYYPVDTQLYTSWKDGFHDFEDMPLGELMKIFSRWYNVKIKFAEPALQEMKFSGRLKRYDDLKPLFKMLEYTRDLGFIIQDDHTIVIQRK